MIAWPAELENAILRCVFGLMPKLHGYQTSTYQKGEDGLHRHRRLSPHRSRIPSVRETAAHLSSVSLETAEGRFQLTMSRFLAKAAFPIVLRRTIFLIRLPISSSPMSSGSKMPPYHRIRFTYSGCCGLAMALRNASKPGTPPTSSGGARRAPSTKRG